MSAYRVFIVLFCIALFTRIIFFFLVSPYKPSVESNIILQNDALEYHLLAKSLVAHHGFTLREGRSPDCLRTPGYPLYISFFYLLFGEKPWIPIFIHLFIDSLSCVLIYRIILKYSTSNIAVVSSLIYSFDPFLIFFSVTLLSEILFIFCLLVATFYFTKVIDFNYNSNLKSSVYMAGLFLGIATLVRPISLYLLIIIPLFLLFLFRKKTRLAFISIILFSTSFLVTLSPWIIRNYVTFKTVSISTSGNINILLLYVSPMEAETRSKSISEAKKELSFEADSIIECLNTAPIKMNDFQRSQYWKALAIQYISKRPTLFLKHYFLGVIHCFTSIGTGQFTQALNLPSEADKIKNNGPKSLSSSFKQYFSNKTNYDIGIGFILAIYLFIEYLCFIIGIIISWKDINKNFLIFCLIMALYFILIVGPYGSVRFRLPAFSFYLVFIGTGLNYLFIKIKSCALTSGSS